MTKKLSEKNYIKNHLLWIAVFVAVFISACSNEVTTPDNVDNPDTTPITLKISTNSTLGKDTPGKIIFFFSEGISNFTTNDIILSDVEVEKGKFTTNDLRTYIWEVTPKETGTLKVVVPANSLTDLADNKNPASFSTNFTVEETVIPDTTPPTLTISTNSSLEQNTLGKINFYFNEDVKDFTKDKINLSGVTLNKGDFIPVSKKEYYWEITPKEIGTLNISIPAKSFKDLAGNTNANSISTNFTVEEDKTPPTVSIAGVYLAENTAGKIIFTFNEDVKDFTKSDIKFSDPDLVTGDFNPNNQKSYELKVTPTAAGTLTVTIDASSLKDLFDNFNQAVSVGLNVDASVAEVDLKGIVTAGRIPSDRSTLKGIAKDVVSYYGGTPTVVAKYVKTDGTGDGSSWAKAASDPKATINGISDASDSKIYLVLVASGNYPSDRIVMKNHVAIIGGWNPKVEWERAGVTRFDGQGRNRVFHNFYNPDRTALLYSASIINGFTRSGSSVRDTTHGKGGGMFNNNSSPSLVKVTFSGNKATGESFGGGMYNFESSSSLVKVTFSGNTANYGGGMYNRYSSPSLENVTFSGNKANSQGGGMANWESSSPKLVKVTFSENKAVLGGGMVIINKSSPKLVNVTFSENTATTSGGGIRIANTSGDGPLLVNTIFWGNLTNGVANQISIGKATDKLRLHYSIIQGGANSLGGVLTSSHTTEGNPLLSSLANNGGLVQTYALGSGSPAINKGVYVKKKGTTFYFSQDNTTWYTGFDNNGLTTTATPPNDAEDLTATDARGYNRVDRPDIGAYENGGTAPSAN